MYWADELAARLAALLRRAEALKAAQSQVLDKVNVARVIAVHSLRGGMGCSSMAVNLAYCLQNLWESPTLLLDMDLSSGQVALLLNESIRRSWADLAVLDDTNYDVEALEGITYKHASGLHFVAAPKDPAEAEEVSSDSVKKAVKILRPQYEYIVADLAHDFGDITLDMLEMADIIILLVAPEIVSIRAASVTLNMYEGLGFDPEKVRLILNQSISHSSLTGLQIEEALRHPIELVIPHAPKMFVTAINSGVPWIESQPDNQVSKLVEEFAFQLSKEIHQLIPPPAPSPAWNRVNKRLQLFGSDRDKTRRGLRDRLSR